MIKHVGYPAVERRKGWKITHVDGTTHGGYRWPLPMPGERVTVEATNIDRSNTGACPSRDGDGVCAVREGVVRHVTSSGVPLARCIGLALEWDAADELGAEADEKVRLARVTVVGLFDPLVLICAGVCADLRGADLRYADLSGANLRYAAIEVK